MGVAGIFLPLLPTTPFLLLAAACFARSSEVFYNWLLQHKRLGPMVKGYLDGKGIPFKSKCIAITLVWITLTLSTILVKPIWIKVFLMLLAVILTCYLAKLPTRLEKL